MSQTNHEVSASINHAIYLGFFLHMAKQLWRSVLLGILLRSSFLHKGKQREL